MVSMIKIHPIRRATGRCSGISRYGSQSRDIRIAAYENASLTLIFSLSFNADGYIAVSRPQNSLLENAVILLYLDLIEISIGYHCTIVLLYGDAAFYPPASA